jgi:hypothetical protein
MEKLYEFEKMPQQVIILLKYCEMIDMYIDITIYKIVNESQDELLKPEIRYE